MRRTKNVIVNPARQMQPINDIQVVPVGEQGGHPIEERPKRRLEWVSWENAELLYMLKLIHEELKEIKNKL